MNILKHMYQASDNKNGFWAREVRRWAGMTQGELATRMDTTQSNVARAESETWSTSLAFLNRVYAAAGITFTSNTTTYHL